MITKIIHPYRNVKLVFIF